MKSCEDCQYIRFSTWGDIPKCIHPTKLSEKFYKNCKYYKKRTLWWHIKASFGVGE